MAKKHKMAKKQAGATRRSSAAARRNLRAMEYSRKVDAEILRHRQLQRAQFELEREKWSGRRAALLTVAWGVGLVSVVFVVIVVVAGMLAVLS